AKNQANRFSRLLDRIVFVGLLAVIVFAVIPYGTVDAWWQAVFECAVFGLTACWLVEALVSGTWQVRALAVLLPLVLLSIYAFAQTVAWPLAWGLGAGDG